MRVKLKIKNWIGQLEKQGYECNKWTTMIKWHFPLSLITHTLYVTSLPCLAVDTAAGLCWRWQCRPSPSGQPWPLLDGSPVCGQCHAWVAQQQWAPASCSPRWPAVCCYVWAGIRLGSEPPISVLISKNTHIHNSHTRP